MNFSVGIEGVTRITIAEDKAIVMFEDGGEMIWLMPYIVGYSSQNAGNESGQKKEKIEF